MIQDKDHITGRRILARAAFQEGRVLEIGCGTGRVTLMYADLPRMTVAVEPDDTAIREAAGTVPEAQAVCASGMHLPFAQGSFDIVLFTLSLHHHPKPETALNEATRMLAPGGRILVLEPATHSEVQRLCSLFNDEDPLLENVEAKLAAGRKMIVSRELFDTEWIFKDFTDVTGYTFTFYNRPFDPDMARTMREFLGPGADQAPLVLTDTLRLTCLEPLGDRPDAQ